MTTTPGKLRTSGIPALGKSSIPTPGRPRSTSSASSASQAAPALPGSASDIDSMRAFQDAIKANDPAQHRLLTNQASDANLASSLLPESSSFALSGRKSITGRPSSVASSTSGVGSTPAMPRYSTARSKTPNARPASRTSDVFIRSSSHAADRPFEVGDNVRIESLGFEGVLRYLGSIDGKSGEWAGVELRGGFAGKGKNDGSVSGRYYFHCPSKCGVFVSAGKLSPPTVGFGAISRPSSVASSHGRMTPSFSGRVTPSSSTGYTTPYGFASSGSGGRITPASTVNRISQRTPSARVHNKTAPISSGDGIAFDISISSGPPSPTQKPTGSGSPTRINFLSSSVSSQSPSAKTPRPSTGRGSGAGLGLPSTTPTKGRSSASFARGRIPSAIAMPPPMSPASASRFVDSSPSPTHTQYNESANAEDLAERNRILQDKITSVMSGVSNPSLAVDQDPEGFRAKVIKLEAESERLRGLLRSSKDQELKVERHSEELRQERDEAHLRISSLEESIKTIERSLHERDVKVEELESLVGKISQEADASSARDAANASLLQSKLDDAEGSILSLKDRLAASDNIEKKISAALHALEAEATALRDELQIANRELHEERKEVDALRTAGQETIALYEERLSEADTRRYEVQEELKSLQEKIRIQSEPVSPTTRAQMLSSAAEIENETLREQISHMQKKLGSLENALEDSRAATHVDEVQFREKLGRYKDKEEALRQQLVEAENESERLLKAETAGRIRVEEIEEALRESAIALENAQGEIENLRAEIANLESETITKSSGAEDVSISVDRTTNLSSENVELRERVLQLTAEADELRKKANRDLSMSSDSVPSVLLKHESSVREEVAGLKHIIQELQKESALSTQQNRILESENQLLLSEAAQLREHMRNLEGITQSNGSRIEQPLHNNPRPIGTNDAPSMQKILRNTHPDHEQELELLRKRLSELEMKSARTIHNLNKEIGELESLVESKIYREDELEQEVERLKDKLARNSRKISKSPTEIGDSQRGTVESTASALGMAQRASRLDTCEICERPGHDIFTCDVLKGETASPSASFPTVSQVYCEDCESHDHTTADCPYSTDVF